MNKRYISLLIILILAISVIYLWNENRKAFKEYNSAYSVQLAKDVEFLTTTLMLNSIPNTFELYSDKFTAEEFSLFKVSLQNIRLDLSVASANIKKIEDIDARDNNLSDSVDRLYQLVSEIQENAEVIDEDVFFKISEITPSYSRKMDDVFYQSSGMENIFKKGPDILEEMNQDIEEMLKQDEK